MIYLKVESHSGCNVLSQINDVRKVCTDVMSSACPKASFRSLINTIKREFKAHSIELEIKTRLINKLDINEFYVNAYYDPESDKNNECAIEVVIYHNIKSDSIFEHHQLGQFMVQIYDAVVHEFRHRYQSRARQFCNLVQPTDVSDTELYLADPDEVDAYAVSIAIELIRNLGNSRAIRYLHKVSRLAKIRPKGLFASVTLYQYFRIFHNTDHYILRKLIKKVYLNLQTIDPLDVFY